MTYQKSETVAEARRKGQVVIMRALFQVGRTRTLRVTKSRPELWKEGVSQAGAKHSELYSIDYTLSYPEMRLMINAWTFEHNKPKVEFKDVDSICIAEFYALACLCAKLKKFPKVRD